MKPNWAVYGAAYRVANLAVGGAGYWAGYLAVDDSVNGAVYLALSGAVDHAPPHSALPDFLASVGKEVS